MMDLGQLVILHKLASEYDDAFMTREWVKKIPFIEFPEGVLVKVIPPFRGAMARFLVARKDSPKHYISVYLDVYSLLGIYDNKGSPYWEIYPYKGDTYRVAMDNTEELVKRIMEALEEE